MKKLSLIAILAICTCSAFSQTDENNGDSFDQAARDVNNAVKETNSYNPFEPGHSAIEKQTRENDAYLNSNDNGSSKKDETGSNNGSDRYYTDENKNSGDGPTDH